ncbi:MAG: membrane-bound lytic murein transglycosylase MltF [Azonexus sp.]
MRSFKTITVGLLMLWLTACDGPWLSHNLPFPTPAQHALVVLTTNGPLTYGIDDNGTANGLEHDLIEAFAQELGVEVKYQVVKPEELAEQLDDGDYHLAAGWFSPDEETPYQATPPIFLTRDVLAQNDASLPLSDKSQLAGQTVHAMSGSRQAATLRRLASEVPDLKVVEVDNGDILHLLEALGNGKQEYVVMDSSLEDLATQFVPTLSTTLELSEEKPIVWLLGRHPNVELAARLRSFIERIQLDGTLARLEDRYIGHVRRLEQADVIKFMGEIETTLPRLRKHFQAAEAITGLDWRLLASVAYHESHWDPNATSYTNVRGIMMLTEETADRLGVGNRLDPQESILAGARYINILKDQVGESVSEPDRTWLALAAYNIGPGHFNAGRRLAKVLGSDDRNWFEMKRILPLLAQPKHYQRIKSSRARGGEAVILVENIRSYYDILQRHETPYLSLAGKLEGMTGKLGSSPGLKLKQAGR